jgi:hypothetical protein
MPVVGGGRDEMKRPNPNKGKGPPGLADKIFRLIIKRPGRNIKMLV